MYIKFFDLFLGCLCASGANPILKKKYPKQNPGENWILSFWEAINGEYLKVDGIASWAHDTKKNNQGAGVYAYIY